MAAVLNLERDATFAQKVAKLNKEPNLDKVLDKPIFRFRRHPDGLKGVCVIRGCKTNIKIHYFRKLKDMFYKKD